MTHDANVHHPARTKTWHPLRVVRVLMRSVRTRLHNLWRHNDSAFDRSLARMVKTQRDITTSSIISMQRSQARMNSMVNITDAPLQHYIEGLDALEVIVASLPQAMPRNTP